LFLIPLGIVEELGEIYKPRSTSRTEQNRTEQKYQTAISVPLATYHTIEMLIPATIHVCVNQQTQTSGFPKTPKSRINNKQTSKQPPAQLIYPTQVKPTHIPTSLLTYLPIPNRLLNTLLLLLRPLRLFPLPILPLNLLLLHCPIIRPLLLRPLRRPNPQRTCNQPVRYRGLLLWTDAG
jgi:hypothetical protein